METHNNSFLRPMKCDIGTFSRTDGSAMFATGDTLVIAGVYGPCEVNSRKLIIDQAMVEVNYKPKTGVSCLADKYFQEIQTSIAEQAILCFMHPRTSISIIIQELNDAGGLLACSINAMCLTLLNSGLPMKFLFAAVNAIIDVKGEICIDPTEQQQLNCQSGFTLVFEQINNNIIASHAHGVYSTDQLTRIVALCKEAALGIFKFYKTVVEKSTEHIGYDC